MLYVGGWDGMGLLSLVICLLRAPSVISNICAKVSNIFAMTTRTPAFKNSENLIVSSKKLLVGIFVSKNV